MSYNNFMKEFAIIVNPFLKSFYQLKLPENHHFFYKVELLQICLKLYHDNDVIDHLIDNMSYRNKIKQTFLTLQTKYITRKMNKYCSCKDIAFIIFLQNHCNLDIVQKKEYTAEQKDFIMKIHGMDPTLKILEFTNQQDIVIIQFLLKNAVVFQNFDNKKSLVEAKQQLQSLNQKYQGLKLEVEIERKKEAKGKQIYAQIKK